MVFLQRENFYTKRKVLQHIRFQLKDILKKSEFLKEVITNTFENCRDCKKMASLPQGAFVACKLGEQIRERDLIVSRLKSSGEKNDPKVFSGNKKLMEYSPVKYNEKLMNSIWGFYNRYSPHNIKSNEIVSTEFVYYQQQQFAAANKAIANNIAMAVANGKKCILMEKKSYQYPKFSSPF